MIKLAVSGCQGRMGQRVTLLALNDPHFEIRTLLERPDHPQIHVPVGGKTISADGGMLAGCDVLIEFTSPEATLAHLQYCLKYRCRMVIGTTGLTGPQVEQIRQASQTIAVVLSANMSIGVNILFKLTQLLAEKAPPAYQVKIREAHHVHKKDAPSGTAKTLAQIIEGRSARQVQDIEAIREGEIIGDHDVSFESPEDLIVIRHHAKTRDIFVKGALVAAKFLSQKTNGFYDMQDVLGLKG